MSFPLNTVGLIKNLSNSCEFQNALNVMKLSILDWAAVGIKGINEPVSHAVSKMISEESGIPEAFVFGSKIGVPARSASLINGVISHALDYDDTNFLYLGHPSVVVNSAVFAVANKIDLSLSSAIECSLFGCEMASRMGVWLGADHYNKGFHITATSGIFGAVLGSCKVLNLPNYVIHNALNLAASKASGLKVQFGSMGKPYHAGMASSSGVEVTILASHGLNSCQNAFDGKHGFGAIYGRSKICSEKNLDDDEFLFTKVKHKFHACCHGTHAAIEALEFLRETYVLKRKEISKIVIKVHPRFATVCNIQEPSSGLEIKFSYRMIAALQMFDYDTSRLDTFSEDTCSNKKLIEFRKKVEVFFDEKLKVSESQVVVELRSGQIYSKKHDLEDSINLKKLESKVRKKASSLIGRSAENEIWGMLADKKVSSNSFMQFLSEQI